jgi:hypothetical protein
MTIRIAGMPVGITSRMDGSEWIKVPDTLERRTLNCLSIIFVTVSAIAGMLAALIHIGPIGTVDDEIRFLQSYYWRAVLNSVDDFNARYGKYGVHIPGTEPTSADPAVIEASKNRAYRITLDRLWQSKIYNRKLASGLVIITAITAVLAVITQK